MTLLDNERATMDAYLEALAARGAFAEYFADDVTIEVVGTGQTAEGPAAAEGMIRYLHEQAFDAGAEVKSLIVAGGRAALEADLVGRHTGEFAGIAPTGRDVRVPYSVHYEIESGRIKALRIYGLAAELVRQIST
jgi:predicted ester cyclase